MSIKHNFEMQAFKIGAVAGKTIFFPNFKLSNQYVDVKILL